MSKLIIDGKEKNVFVCAIVAAAGSSSRMEGTDKQFLLLDGVPALARSIDALQKSAFIDEVVVCTRADLIDRVNALVKQYAFTKVADVCEGGDTRVRSVSNAVAHCSKNADLIAIHDGARPFVTGKTIEKTVLSAYLYGAAACAVRVKDTVKIADADGFVDYTPDRNTLWAVQTPQVFDFQMYKSAIKNAPENATDDCMIAEAAGCKVKLVEGEYTNIKITTPDDIVTAQAILKGRLG